MTLLTAAQALEAGAERVGGKAFGLAKLVEAGARVPEFRVLPIDESVDPNALTAALAAMPGPWAVRSSAVGEDSAEHSFAGMFDSFVFLRDADSVLDAIARCHDSAASARALAYSGERKPMAAVIQSAVEGEVSGVLFTSNPISGRAEETLVSAAYGLAEGVVSGRCDTDEYVVGHDGSVIAATIADKQTQIVPNGNGTHEQPVPDGVRRTRTLTEAQLRELTARATALADRLGGPQDIEWTLAGGELHFLQARPITAKASPLGAHRIVWDNSNIQESFNGVTTPLTFSVAVKAYASVYEQTLRLLGVPEQTIAEYRPALRNMIGFVDGRVYYNIENWYRCLLLLPSFDRSKADMERMMGLEHPVDLVRDVNVSGVERVKRLPSLAVVGVRLTRAFRRLDTSVERFLANFEARTAGIDREQIAGAPFDELLTLADRLDREVVGDWTTPIVNDIYVMTTTGRVRKQLLKAGHDNPDALIAGLLSGEPGIESMEPTRRLMEIARTIAANPRLMAALYSAEPLDALRADFSAELDEFLARYGDRCMGEMKLETPSLRQDPSFIVQVLKNFADLENRDLEEREAARRSETERDAFRGIGAWRRRRLRRALARARFAVKSRENMRLSRTRFVGLYRDIYLAAGERLHEAGLLERPRDVLFLTGEELTAYHEGTAVTTDLAGLADLRRQEYQQRRDAELPNHFESVGGVHHGSRVAPLTDTQSGAILHGTGCSAGIVEGEVRVVRSPDDDLDLNGRILTAVRTDPGWTPLFPGAAGILVERGSALSHSAVLARELGIPAVVGIPGLLKTVRDGERVRLDGGRGLIERLDPV